MCIILLDDGREKHRGGATGEIVEEIIVADREYMIKNTQAPDQGRLTIVGFGVIDTLEGVEIAGVTPKARRRPRQPTIFQHS